MASIIDELNHWNNRANDLRQTAARQADQMVRQMLIDMAKQYDLLAKRAERRLAGMMPADKGR